ARPPERRARCVPVGRGRDGRRGHRRRSRCRELRWLPSAHPPASGPFCPHPIRVSRRTTARDPRPPRGDPPTERGIRLRARVALITLPGHRDAGVLLLPRSAFASARGSRRSTTTPPATPRSLLPGEPAETRTPLGFAPNGLDTRHRRARRAAPRGHRV